MPEYCLFHFPNVVQCFVLSDQHSKTKKIQYFNDIKQRKGANLQKWEAGTRIFFGIFAWKFTINKKNRYQFIFCQSNNGFINYFRLDVGNKSLNSVGKSCFVRHFPNLSAVKWPTHSYSQSATREKRPATSHFWPPTHSRYRKHNLYNKAHMNVVKTRDKLSLNLQRQMYKVHAQRKFSQTTETSSRTSGSTTEDRNDARRTGFWMVMKSWTEDFQSHVAVGSGKETSKPGEREQHILVIKRPHRSNPERPTGASLRRHPKLLHVTV